MKQLFVVVHGEAQHQVEGRVGGWYDTGLTENGRQQAEVIAGRLRQMAGKAPVEVLSSDLRRAAETAAPIAARLGVEVELMPELREMRYGVAEGQPQSWLGANRVPPAQDEQLDYRGVIRSETRRELATRIYRAVDAIVARPAETQVVVTHGFALTFVVAAWVGMPIEALGRVNFAVGAASITHLLSDPYWRNRAVASLGDTRHLRP